ncbi:MAG: cytidine deaminase [Sphaerochaetaceae bacterium]|jgi:cytidine deaminase|nr:cytidine deaminase [Sphaerochaetaceae bacterium]MDD3162566.1 cytidine deaminase [Sphaerochaetaceae bacterium]MDD4006344.1 cytidine deaminase [Sphaerochaetaceae bacterium]MDD4396045.1 cytidine deaminase [Sphaerochaetaceae bacterium]
METNDEQGKELIQKLILTALDSRRRSYVPYSGFSVGAALLGKSGKIYCGCNIENSSFGATNCAERTAFFSAVNQGEKEFDAIAIVGGKAENGPSSYCPPCGICRQVMLEFCDPDKFRIILAKSKDDFCIYKLSQLIPVSFGPKDLGK